MKILLVNDYGTPTAGAEVQMLGLRERLRARGHDARLLSSSACHVGLASEADYVCLGTTSRWRGLLQTANPWAYALMRRTLKEFRPDVVHVRVFLTQLSPSILPLLKSVPSLYQPVWYRAICPTGTKMLPDGRSCTSRAGAVCYRAGCLPLHDWLPLMLQLKYWQRRRDTFKLIVANSHAVKRRLMDEGIAPIEVVWNGVRVRPLRPPLDAPPTVAFAGRLVPQKGLDVLLRAFAKVVREVPCARLVVAGEGSERERARALVDELQLAPAVSLLGHLTRAEVERRFDAAWVQVVPSRFEEPFANAGLEALMRGTALVASDAGGMNEMIRDGETGFLVPRGDADALAATLLRLLRDRELAERVGQSGRAFALAEFTQEKCVDKFLNLYEALAQGSFQGKHFRR